MSKQEKYIGNWGAFSFLLNTLSVIYISYLLCYATVFDIPRSYLMRYRPLRELLSCPLCVGFWSALLVFLCPQHVTKILGVAGANLIYWSYSERGQM